MLVVWQSLWVVEMGAEMEAQRVELWSLIREVQLLACASMLPTLSALLTNGLWSMLQESSGL